MFRRTSLACLLVLAPASLAAAEPAAPAAEEGAQVIVTDPYGQPVQQQTVVTAEPVTAQQGRGLQYGATLLSPIWVGNLGESYLPGIGLYGRIGYEIGGGLSLEAGIGVHWNAENNNVYGDMTNVFLTAGVRYGILNPSALVPFIQGGLQLNLWDFCTEFGCSKYSEMTFGFYGGAGLIYELNYNAALELGLNVNYSLQGDVFYDWEVPAINLAPFIGITLYY